MNRILSWRWPLLASLSFLLGALALLPYPGLQNDELFFAGPIYADNAAFYSLEIGTLKIPLMVMSYTGALKTWLYAGLFQLFEPTRWSVRLPMVLVAIASLWLTWIQVRRFWNGRAAAVTVVLLGTDAIYLMTSVFDWGPVALQHLFLMAGLVAFGSRKLRPVAFALWGLGMWDKALMSWPLIGLAIAALCVYPKQVRRELRWREVLIALVAFTAGAAPLVWYNIQKPGETASANVNFTASGIEAKAIALRQTVEGSSLFGYIVYSDAAPMKRAPRTLVERASTLAVGHRTNWMAGGYLAAFIAFVALIRTPAARPLAFLLITMTVEWLQMALTYNTGGAAHHTILIWPFPVVFLAIALTEAAARMPRLGTPALRVAVGLLALGNVLNTGEYVRALAVNGPAGGWTDAIYPLANSVESNTAAWIGLVDWGYLNGLRLLHEGDLPLFLIDAKQPDLLNAIRPHDRIYIQHTKDKQIFPGVNDRLREAAGALGYSERVKRIVNDRNGRPVFELFRFEKQ